MKIMRSGIVLAGGRSTRFGGVEKSLELVEGKRMICRAIDSICGAVDEVIISVRDERQRDILAPFVSSYMFVFDEAEGFGPIAGLRSAFKEAKGDYAVVVACDMPYVSTAAIELLFHRAEGHDAAVPRHDNGLVEPLHAVYRRASMLDAIVASMNAGESRVSAALHRLNDVVYVPVEEIDRVSPDHNTFMNVNRAVDMEGINGKKQDPPS
jgi:molybdopterin-guanine dinucleotide biosynthesis protein A